jgi:hypothetical protein
MKYRGLIPKYPTVNKVEFNVNGTAVTLEFKASPFTTKLMAQKVVANMCHIAPLFIIDYYLENVNIRTRTVVWENTNNDTTGGMILGVRHRVLYLLEGGHEPPVVSIS